jgi:hypothetical protein
MNISFINTGGKDFIVRKPLSTISVYHEKDWTNWGTVAKPLEGHMLTFVLTRATMGNMKWLDNESCLSFLLLNGTMHRNVTPAFRDTALIP